MDKQSIIAFFDQFAPCWDENNVHNGTVINQILNYAGAEKGVSLLDVACGTGVLFDYYSKRGVTDVTAIDISPEMVKKAKEKYEKVNVVCGDAEEYSFGKIFNCIVIYNAYPHFVSAEKLFENLSSNLQKGGRLTVAHGASRDDIIKCHSGEAKNVSALLPTADELAELMGEYLLVDIIISDDEKYVVSGYKN